MYLTYTLPLLSFLLPDLASAAGWKNLDPSKYTLRESAYYKDRIDPLAAVLPNRNVSSLLADANHANPLKSPLGVQHVVDSFSWASSSNFDDFGTTKWYPQGVTGSHDADASGLYDDSSVLLVSWHSDKYDNGKRGARVSFVDRSDPSKPKYRHALLVYPNTDANGKPSFRGIKLASDEKGLHAGGIMWYGDLLYVVDTLKGVRVFNMRCILEVDDSGVGIGYVGDGKYQAYGYKYILPQVRSYTPPEEGFRFSFMSLDRTVEPHSILIGEWSPSRTDCRLARYDLDPSTHLLATSSSKIATASEVLQHPHTDIQGAIRIDGKKYFLTQSTKNLKAGSLITWTKGADDDRVYKGALMKGPEDLSYRRDGEGGKKELWTLSEHPGRRYVYAVDVDAF